MKPLAILAGASLLALAGTASVAQPSPTAPSPDAQAQTRRSDAEALLDARIAGVRAGLKLTPEQERLFAPVEQAYRSMAAERTRRIEEFREQRGRPSENREQLDLMQRLDRRAERATQNAQRIAGLASVMRPFWASLDDNQKRLLPRLMRAGREGRRMEMRRFREHHRMERGGPRMDRETYRL
jgi:zinc resistance-associated protein